MTAATFNAHPPFTGAEFRKGARTLRSNSYSPLPIKSGTKRPSLNGWSDKCVNPLNDLEIQGLSYTAGGIGVACGYNRSITIDIDTNDEKLQTLIAGVLPSTPVRKRGKKGISLCFRFEDNEVPSYSLIGKDGGRLIDILGDGRQTVIPPTIHPETGAPYVWDDPKATLYNTQVSGLPMLTRAHIEALEEVLRPYLREQPSWSAEEKLNHQPLPADHDLSDAERKRYAGFAMSGISARAKEISQAPSGTRNQVLFAAPCYFGKFLHHGLIPEKGLVEPLIAACHSNGLVRDDGMPAVIATIRSGLRLSRNDPLPALADRPKPGPDGNRSNACQKEETKADDKVSDENAAPSGHSDGSRDQTEWSEPGEIEAPLRPVAPFNAEALLPECVRGFVTDAAWRMPCAVDYIAAALIVMAGTTIGARAGIKPKCKDDWIVVSNLWGGIVGDPSQKKSPAIGEAMRPISKLIAKDEQEFGQAQEGLAITKFIRDAQKDNTKEKLKKAVTGKGNGDLEALTKELKQFIATDEPEPVRKRRKTNDASVEKLGEMLRDNPDGMLVLRDEVVGLLASWDKIGHEGDRTFFLEGWNGTDSFDTDRIGRGSILIPNLCVSVFGGIQPDKLIGYLEQASNALGNDGMLQRFQVLVYPDPVPWDYRDETPDRKSRERVNDIFDQLDSFDPVAWGAEPAGQFAKFPHFKFAPDAQETYIDFSMELHRTIEAEDSSLMRQHLAKYDKLFPALALILHLIESADTGRRGPVSKAATLRGAAWCRYLETHARRCYGLLADEGLRAAQTLAKRLRDYKLPKDFDPAKHFNPEDFTLRDIRRHQWRYLTTDEAINAALDWLEDESWVRSRKVGGTGRGGGRATIRYELNPRVRDGNAGQH